MAPSARSLAMPPAPPIAHDNCASSYGGCAALLALSHPSHLGRLQFKPMRGVVSDAEVEKTLKKRNPAKGGE